MQAKKWHFVALTCTSLNIHHQPPPHPIPPQNIRNVESCVRASTFKTGNWRVVMHTLSEPPSSVCAACMSACPTPLCLPSVLLFPHISFILTCCLSFCLSFLFAPSFFFHSPASSASHLLRAWICCTCFHPTHPARFERAARPSDEEAADRFTKLGRRQPAQPA